MNRTVAICLTVLVVGLVNAWVLFLSFAQFNQAFLSKNFYDSSSYVRQTLTQAIRLNDRQFVVVDSDAQTVSVYRVNEDGTLKRGADVETRSSPLKPIERGSP